MYEVSVSVHFSAAHRIGEYSGKCERMHGHNWKVEVTVKASELNELGMVIDFRDLKKIVTGVLDEVDHRVINDIEPFTSLNPTAENLARWVHDKVLENLSGHSVEGLRIRIWETDSSCASYSS